MKLKYNTTSFDATADDLCPRKGKQQTQIIKDDHQINPLKKHMMKDPPITIAIGQLKHQKNNFNNLIKNLQL
ncbi:hypothetical protein M2T82_00660 [Elizabethkingia ursingii]|uniref:hypothetical protein n=1 Tax=Elizabethkingia ursingii TaxID=1756150 RepID=UPI00201265E6|nr:hypothetical protein [Elizabethkingia ursingii]MCL1666564.1 hypothetical protein [Elizabethkingia ursingii]